MGIGPLIPAVFLDRDGVINRSIVRDGKPYPPQSLAELELVPGAPAALASLHNAGFRLIVVTNQPDVARGTQSREAIDGMHDELRRMLPIDDFFVCDHDDRDGCDCRKPLPGLLTQAAARYGIPLNESFLIGDRWRDVDAGHRAGVRTVLIEYGYQERGPEFEPNARVHTIEEAAAWILQSATK